MCKAFSCLVDIAAKTTWKFGVDSHSELVTLAGYKDQTADPAQMEFARVEIAPKNGNYLFPDEWIFAVDERITPVWLEEKHKTACWTAHKKWLRQLDKIIVRKEIVDPFRLTPPAKITKRHVALLKEWDSVRASVGASVRASVRASVGDSVRDSVWAYTGTFFRIPTWKYIRHPKGEYQFAPCVKLWEMGLVPSFDGKTWRLHGGPRAAVLCEIRAETLRGVAQ